MNYNAIDTIAFFFNTKKSLIKYVYFDLVIYLPLLGPALPQTSSEGNVQTVRRCSCCMLELTWYYNPPFYSSWTETNVASCYELNVSNWSKHWIPDPDSEGDWLYLLINDTNAIVSSCFPNQTLVSLFNVCFFSMAARRPRPITDGWNPVPPECESFYFKTLKPAQDYFESLERMLPDLGETYSAPMYLRRWPPPASRSPPENRTWRRCGCCGLEILLANVPSRSIFPYRVDVTNWKLKHSDLDAPEGYYGDSDDTEE